MRIGSKRALRFGVRAVAPVPLLLGVAAWWRADSLTVDGLVDNDPVPLWRDESGNGYDVSQGTVAKQPIYKTGIHASLPVVQPDGVDDFLRRSVTDWEGGNSAFTLFVLYIAKHPTTAAITQVSFGSADDTPAGDEVFFRCMPFEFTGAGGSNLGIGTRDSGVPFDNIIETSTHRINDDPTLGAAVLCFRSTGSIYEFIQNRTTHAAVAFSGANDGKHFSNMTGAETRDNLTLFAFDFQGSQANFTKADGTSGYGEIAYFGFDLGAANITAMFDYFTAKWGSP